MKISELEWDAGSEATYDEDLLLNIHSGIVVLLIRGRNAWHTTWVQHFLRNATMYSDVESARAGAESQRERGNVFYVREVPAIQLCGSSSNVVLCDSHPDNPFGRFEGIGSEVHPSEFGDWVGGVFPGVSVKDAVSAFTHDSGYWKGPEPDEHSLRTGRLPEGFRITQRRGTLTSLVSKAAGVNFYLDWIPTSLGTSYSMKGANSVAKRWEVVLKEVESGSEQMIRDPREMLSTYRDETLKAIPKSVWNARKAEDSRQFLLALSTSREQWFAAMDRAAELEEDLESGQLELIAAREDRMHPKETSQGIRKQRERVEAATARVEKLERDLAEAQKSAGELWDTYQAISQSS
jgi:hypothetical protein